MGVERYIVTSSSICELFLSGNATSSRGVTFSIACLTPAPGFLKNPLILEIFFYPRRIIMKQEHI